MTTTRAIALAIVIAVPVGLLASYFYGQFEGPGPKLRRECVSLVDTVLNEEPTVRTNEVKDELAKRGISLPSFPTFPDSPTGADFAKYEAEKKAYDAKWEEVRAHPEYNVAWKSVFAKKREQAIKNCVYDRARKEGVRDR